METGNWKGGWFNALMKCFNAFVPLPSWLDDASLQHHLFIYFTNHTLHFFCFGNQCHTFGKECLGNLGTLFSYSYMANSYSISIPKKKTRILSIHILYLLMVFSFISFIYFVAKCTLLAESIHQHLCSTNTAVVLFGTVNRPVVAS